MASAFWKLQFLFLLLTVWFYSCVDGKSERILTSSTDVNGERLHQMDLTIQNMKSQISGYDNMIQQIQTLLSQKDTEIKNLTAEISSLKRKVAFMAELTGTYLHPTSGRHIVYDNLYLNDGNGYHSSHGTFIAPYRGLYHFSYGCTAHLGANTRTHLNMLKNGNPIGYLFFDNLDTGNPWIKETESILTNLEAGDEIWIQVTQAIGAVEIATGGMHTYFSGYLIS